MCMKKCLIVNADIPIPESWQKWNVRYEPVLDWPEGTSFYLVQKGKKVFFMTSDYYFGIGKDASEAEKKAHRMMIRRQKKEHRGER